MVQMVRALTCSCEGPEFISPKLVVVHHHAVAGIWTQDLHKSKSVLLPFEPSIQPLRLPSCLASSGPRNTMQISCTLWLLFICKWVHTCMSFCVWDTSLRMMCKWIQLDTIILSELSQTQKDMHVCTHLQMYNNHKVQDICMIFLGPEEAKQEGSLQGWIDGSAFSSSPGPLAYEYCHPQWKTLPTSIMYTVSHRHSNQPFWWEHTLNWGSFRGL